MCFSFGWLRTEWDWDTNGTDTMTSSDRIARLRIQLDDIEPAIWRRVEVPLSLHLKGLHDVIQAVMLFEDSHLFEFRVGDRRYAVPDPEWDRERRTYSARNLRIGALVAKGITTFSYTYDFGDNWRHSITIEAVGGADPAAEYPRFIEGERRAPPDDVGGTMGFETFLEAMADPRHDEHGSVMRWYGQRFDPNDIGLEAITERITKLARCRALGKASHAMSKSPRH